VDKALYIGNYNTERKTKQIPKKQVRQHKYKTKYKVPAATKHGHEAKPGANQPEACQP
jgi:hypothetical protein